MSSEPGRSALDAGRRPKLDLFLETVQELRENNHRALVFSQFVATPQPGARGAG